MIQTLWIPHVFPSLNEVIDAAKGANGRGILYQKLKRELTGVVALRARAARLQPMKSAHLTYQWYERDRRRDPDNIAAGGRKFIGDGLVMAEVLPNDGWDEIRGWSDTFEVRPIKTGVLVTLTGEAA